MNTNVNNDINDNQINSKEETGANWIDEKANYYQRKNFNVDNGIEKEAENNVGEIRLAISCINFLAAPAAIIGIEFSFLPFITFSAAAGNTSSGNVLMGVVTAYIVFTIIFLLTSYINYYKRSKTKKRKRKLICLGVLILIVFFIYAFFFYSVQLPGKH
ncbi:MAG: hypothetical protein IJH13_02710 [Bacilli bacterium]|nr:hypothetical protein [Bacilli bacterium]